MREPIKTVIKIESPRPMRPDSDSDTSSSLSQTSDTELSPLDKKLSAGSSRQSGSSAGEATLNSRNLNINTTPDSVEYMNTGKNRKPDTNGNGSDTDSGVGGEGDRNLSIIQDDSRSYGRSNGHQTERVSDDWDTPPDTPTDTPTDTPSDIQSPGVLELPRQTELQLDLSKFIKQLIFCESFPVPMYV